MNTTEQYIFNQHMKNLDVRFEDFTRETMNIQTPDCLSVILATDVHYIRKYALYTPAYYKLNEMVDFSGFIGADLLALLGDSVDGNTTIKRQYRDLYDVIGLLKKSKTKSVLLSKGNHDSCEWYAYEKHLGEGNWLSDRDWYIHAINPLRVQYPMALDENNVTGGYCYIDFPFQKIRVINLNTNDTERVLDESGFLKKKYCSQWRLGMREMQLKWLVKTLKFDEPGWSVIFMAHDFLKPYGEFGGKVSNGEQAWKIILGFMNKAKGCVKNDEEYYEANVEYNFINNKSNDVLTYLFGHIHDDLCIEQNNVKAISSKNILNCKGDWNNEKSEISGGWDFVSIDKKARTFKSLRFGVDNANRSFVL